MPRFETVHRLFHACVSALIFQGNTYHPAYMDSEGHLRHDAHVEATYEFAKRLSVAYSDIDSTQFGVSQ